MAALKRNNLAGGVQASTHDTAAGSPVGVCPECGAPRGGVVHRGALLIREEPDGVYWHGKLLPMARRHTAILRILARFGEVPTDALEHVGTGQNAASKTFHVRMHQLRRCLPAGLRIENIRGWGYRLLDRTINLLNSPSREWLQRLSFSNKRVHRVPSTASSGRNA